MHEILFRAKAINRDKGYHKTSYKNGDWVYGLVTRLYDERFENLPAEMTNINGVSGIEVDYKTIGQYTGMTDKNGKMIFEGDILQYEWSGKKNIDYIEYSGNMFTYSECIRFSLSDDEVIGNIHDNPEILKNSNP